MKVLNIHERELEADAARIGALIDSLATAQGSLGETPTIQPWSLWVKILRWVVSGGKARSQAILSA